MKIGKKILIILLIMNFILEGVILFMAHDKVFGFCENLCNVEVIAKENVSIITGTVTIAASDNETVAISYPTGYTVDNCVPIACGIKIIESKGFNYEGTYDDGGDILNNSCKRRLNLNSTNIKLAVYNPYTDAEKTVSYKIVLMKVS